MTDRKQDIVERLRATGMSSAYEAAAEIERLRAGLRALFDDYKALADSGDAGFWALEDTDVGKATLAILADAPPCPSAPGSVE